MQRIVGGMLLGLAVVAGLLFAAGRGWLGATLRAGSPTATARPEAAIAGREAQQAAAAAAAGVSDAKQILFGDFHVHTGFSTDAFTMSMPLTGGTGICAAIESVLR